MPHVLENLKTHDWFTLKNLLQLLFLTLVILTITSSCSNGELSRNQAKAAIISKHQFPLHESMELEKIYIKSHATFYGSGLPRACLVSGPMFRNAQNLLRQLETRGVIIVSENGPVGNCRILQAVVKLTPEGQRYLLGETKDQLIVKTHDLLFGDVTGILTHKQHNTAVVEYTILRESTPFDIYDSAESRNMNEHFILYDDGWRIK